MASVTFYDYVIDWAHSFYPNSLNNVLIIAIILKALCHCRFIYSHIINKRELVCFRELLGIFPCKLLIWIRSIYQNSAACFLSVFQSWGFTELYSSSLHFVTLQPRGIIYFIGILWDSPTQSSTFPWKKKIVIHGFKLFLFYKCKSNTPK